MKAMILAAGLGTRMQPLSALRPKPALPIRGVPVIATSRAIELRGSSKFANGHDQCLVQQSTVGKIFNQCRETNIELGAEDVLHTVVVVGMGVPQRTVRAEIAGLSRPLHVNKSHAGLDQPPGQQHALPPLATTVPVTKLGRLLLDGECRTSFPVGENPERFAAVTVEITHGVETLHVAEVTVDLVQQRGTAREAKR